MGQYHLWHVFKVRYLDSSWVTTKLAFGERQLPSAALHRASVLLWLKWAGDPLKRQSLIQLLWVKDQGSALLRSSILLQSLWMLLLWNVHGPHNGQTLKTKDLLYISLPYFKAVSLRVCTPARPVELNFCLRQDWFLRTTSTSFWGTWGSSSRSPCRLEHTFSYFPFP